jgi:zinc protease
MIIMAKMARSFSFFQFVYAILVCFLTSTAALADPPATQPAAGELIQNKSEMVGYGAETARLINQPDEIVSILRNGTTVIVKRIPSPVVAVRGYCLTGGVYEGRWLGGGLSHLLEHLVAGGSSQRRTEAQNKSLLQRIGNDSNAYTTMDHTAFFVNTTISHLDEAVDLVTGWMLGARITVPEYRREYQVVQRELERGKGVPDQVFWNLILANRYHVSPTRVPVIGYQEVIQGLSRDDVYSYYQLAYQPNNMIFSVVGDIDPEKMLAVVRRNVADCKPGRVFSHDVTQEPPVLGPRTLVATFPHLGPARVDLSFASVRLDNPDLYALDLLATVLGGGESSILVEDLRDRQQLVSNIGCGDWTPAFDSGSFQIDFDADPSQVQAAIAAALADVAEVRDHGVSDDRLARAKVQTRMGRLKSMQTSADVAASLAIDYMTTGDPHFSDRYVERIAQVGAAEVQAVARKYLDAGRLITTVLLPSEAVGSGGLPKAVDLIRPSSTSVSAATAGPQAVQRFVLDNGTVLLLKRFTNTPLVSVQMYSVGGVTAEDASTNGLGNLTMSMLRRGAGTHSAQQIAEFFDSIGGDLSTSCGNNTWSWTMGCAKDDLPAALAEYADIVLHPTFPDSETAEMKQRLAAAIAGQDADWHSRAFRFFKQKFFGPKNSPYQFVPIGTIENLQKFTTAQMKDWYTSKVLAAPRVLAIFGDVDTQTAKDLAARYLGGGPTAPAIAAAGPYASPAQSIDDQTPFLNVQRVEIQKTEQGPASVVIGFDSHGIIGEPAEATGIRAFTLAGGFSYPTGYIFETLRGLGLSYEAAALGSPGRSVQFPGGAIAYAACEPRNVNQVASILLMNMARLQSSDADMQPDWFARSGNLITTADALEHETPDAQAQRVALDELFGLGFDYHNQFGAQINAVTLDDIRAFARGRLRDCVVTICTPDPEGVQIATGRREYGSFPTVDLTPKGIQLDQGAPK